MIPAYVFLSLLGLGYYINEQGVPRKTQNISISKKRMRNELSDDGICFEPPQKKTKYDLRSLEENISNKDDEERFVNNHCFFCKLDFDSNEDIAFCKKDRKYEGEWFKCFNKKCEKWHHKQCFASRNDMNLYDDNWSMISCFWCDQPNDELNDS